MLHSRRDGDRQDGQIIVLFELCLIVILVCAALVIDLGLLRNNRQILVNTFDAAALAGGSQLPVDGLMGPDNTGPYGATQANALINGNIHANFPNLPTTAYSITYKCLIGADPTTGAPLISRDVPAACNPPKGVGHTPVVAGDFKGAGPTRVSACNPMLGDKCNVVVITGSETTPYSIGPVVGVKSGSTGTVVSAACNGPCGASPIVPVDLVIILDRTLSMQGTDSAGNNKIASLQTAAKAVLGVYDPAKQRVALALTGPSVVDASGNPMKTCNSNTAYGNNSPNDVNFFPETTLSGATTTVSSATTTLKDPTTTVSAAIASTTLASKINSTSSTSISVAATTGFPSVPFYIQVDLEQMQVTATSGTTWTVTRGANSTTKATHSVGATVTYLAVGPTATTINVAATTGFPSAPFTIQVDSEQMSVTGVSGTAWTVSRGTPAAAHAGGATAILVVTNTSTTIPVTAKTGFPTTFPFSIKVDTEQMTVTGSPSGTLWTVTRSGGVAHNNLAPVSWDVGKADTTIFVTAKTGFPTIFPFTIQVDSEQMQVTGSPSATTWTVVRGQNSTTAAVHAGGATATLVISKTDTTIQVATAIGFPATGSFRILVDSEQMQVSSVSGTDTPTTTWTVTRGFNSTTAATHSVGATVSNLNGWTPSANTAGVWVPVGLSGTDHDLPPAYNPGGTGGNYLNASSDIVKAITCISAVSVGTTLATPIAMAKWYLDTYGRVGVTKGILLETDGQPQDPTGVGANRDTLPFTCGAAITAATAAKAEGIKIYSVGYGVSASCQSTSTNSAETNPGMSATTLLQTLASGTAAPYFFSSPTGSNLAGYFRQIAADLAHSGAHLVQLYPAPIVTGAGGATSSVTISGQYFTGAYSVTFGGTSAISATVTNDTSITAKAPAKAIGTVVDVVVTTAGGSSAVTSVDKYTYPP